ncbi:hypothetical protein QJS04_geneDACA000979 [Acorus gramineus]|uniref:Vacuolar iron transporter n=1 Tax=Acorus gramineus TaxID=55184 RepID=A0AAV9AB06_ACOGR|nr:hypothetical protein QJS04_geneDACA000979 [Acorus gramineus]
MDYYDNSSTTALLLPRFHSEEKEMKKTSTWMGKYAKSIIYAGLDSIITSFSLISSISAGHLSSVDVLVLGFANLVADGISMGFGDFMSSSTERDMAIRERTATEREVAAELLHPHHSVLLATYQDLGMDPDDARMVVSVFSKYKDILVDEKMMAQKGMMPPREAEKPWKNGVVTFFAFILFGCAPLLSFMVLVPFTRDESVKFVGACVLSVSALALLGAAKARISGQSWVYSVAVTLFNGGVAAASAYLIGWLLRNVAGLEE